jgi:hypothetical protein
MEIKKDGRPDVLLPKKPNAVFNHPMGFPLYDGLTMDMHAMRFAEALLKDNDELRAALVERVPLSQAQIEALPMWVRFVGLFPATRKDIARGIEAAHGITAKPLFADLIATHEGLAEELRAADNIKES